MSRDPNTIKLTWTELKVIINRGDLHVLGRSVIQQLEYDSFCEAIKAEWVSIADYLLHSKFNIPYTSETSSSKKLVDRSSYNKSEVITKLLPNDFPYYFDECIDHFIYWKLGGSLSCIEVEEIARNVMSDVNSKYIDYQVYINPAHLKSIPEIEHAHILFYEHKDI